jgi:hypothetical protein
MTPARGAAGAARTLAMASAARARPLRDAGRRPSPPPGAFRRKRFVCGTGGGADGAAALFRVCDKRCEAAPSEGLLWYTSCGVAAEEGWHLAVLGHALALLLLALVPFRARPPTPVVEAFKLPEGGWVPCSGREGGFVRAKKVE